MKYFLSLWLFSLYLFGSDIPTWFLERSIKADATKIIGYGEDESLQAAINNAKADISSQINTKIQSTLSLNKSVLGNEYKRDMKESLKASTSATISDTTIIKQDKIDSNWFVAMEYENIPSINKFVKKLPVILEDQAQNNYLKNSSFFKELRGLVGKNINAKLIRKDGLWQIQYEDILQPLDERSFEGFFASVPNESLQIKLNKSSNLLYEGDKFDFETLSKENGYVSILDVFEDGGVAVLAQNIKISKNKKLKIPSEDDENVFEAATLFENKDSFDLFVAIFSDKPLNFDDFASADEEINQDEKSKKFDKLIELLSDKSFSTLKVITRAR